MQIFKQYIFEIKFKKTKYHYLVQELDVAVALNKLLGMFTHADSIVCIGEVSGTVPLKG